MIFKGLIKRENHNQRVKFSQRVKRGDTLIEVALAIGIFSMVAITIVSVTSASTTGAQSSLEVTLTREELDIQAEALRFIHESYVAGTQSKDTSSNKYAKLWQQITSRAAEPDADVSYNPEVCSSLYTGSGNFNSIAGKDPFIINTRKLYSAEPDDVIVAPATLGGSGVFFEATTFPRIIYNTSATATSPSEDFYNQTEGENGSLKKETVQRVEGIYVIAVKGESQYFDGAAGATGTIKKDVTYFDFYIRSCWMPPGATRASTISTVVRLYDPSVITY